MTHRMLFGLKVVIMPAVPRFTLSLAVPVTDEFRHEFNKWAAGFFGYDEPLTPVIDLVTYTIHISESDYRHARAAMAEVFEEENNRIMRDLIYGPGGKL